MLSMHGHTLDVVRHNVVLPFQACSPVKAGSRTHLVKGLCHLSEVTQRGCRTKRNVPKRLEQDPIVDDLFLVTCTGQEFPGALKVKNVTICWVKELKNSEVF